MKTEQSGREGHIRPLVYAVGMYNAAIGTSSSSSSATESRGSVLFVGGFKRARSAGSTCPRSIGVCVVIINRGM